MEKLRFFVGAKEDGREEEEEAGLRRRRSAASNMSVGVGGGEQMEEEKELERRERGEEGSWGENREAGESHTRIIGEAASCRSSVLMKEMG